jgi:hypothetical protein
VHNPEKALCLHGIVIAHQQLQFLSHQAGNRYAVAQQDAIPRACGRFDARRQDAPEI